MRGLQRLRATLQRATPPPSTDPVEPLLDFVPRITPRWSRPEHLRPLAELLERAEREPVRALVSVPPRHGKTELVLHAIAWWLRRHPEQACGYASYAADLARSKSRQARDYAQRAGVRLRDDSKALAEWRTPEGGGLLATGVGGPLTGHGVGLLFVDDPHKNRLEAESATIRDAVHGWFTSTAMTRVEPRGSVIVVHTRWHPDDLIGRLADDDESVGWEVVSLPAIAELDEPSGRRAGEALWADRWPVEALERRRREVGEYDWASLYQGRPRPRGGSVFGDAHLYTSLPSTYRVAIGVDLAYTERTSSDYSVAVVMAESAGTFFVLDVVRLQVSAPTFGERLRALREAYAGARLFSYVGGTEKGVADFLRREGVPLETRPAVADKFVRSQPAAAAWNQGRILLPASAPAWVDPLLGEVRAFTGVKDRRDDQVDALVAAHDALVTNVASPSSFDKFRSRLPSLRS